MRMEKKRILKEDGRYLVYYHFPDTAAPAETAAFAEIHSVDAGTEHRLTTDTPVLTNTPAFSTKITSEEPPRV